MLNVALGIWKLQENKAEKCNTDCKSKHFLENTKIKQFSLREVKAVFALNFRDNFLMYH